MIKQQRGTSGSITEETETFDVTYPAGGDSSFQDVTVATPFTMGAGSMVIVSIDQPLPVFIVPIAAGIDAAGVVSIRLFYVLAVLAPTVFNTHLCVKAHNPQQYGQ